MKLRLGGVAVGVAATVALAGCSHRAAPNPSAPAAVGTPASSAPALDPSASAAAGSPAVPTAEPDSAPPGTRTCAELSSAINQGSLMEPGVVGRIVAASATADAPVADAAHRLAAAYAAAAGAGGTGREADEVAAVSAAAADMDGVCHESGLDSTG